MTQEEVLKIFRDNGALLEGHFKLSSGLHSGRYLQCALLLQYPDIAGKLCRELANKFSGRGITIVLGPALGGVIISYEVARILGAKSLFAERNQSNAMVLRRGFSIDKSDRVLLVEDVITTGGSVLELADIVKSSGAELAGIGSLMDRSSGNTGFNASFKALAKLDLQAYEQKDCPYCRQGLPLVKPGSKNNKE